MDNAHAEESAWGAVVVIHLSPSGGNAGGLGASVKFGPTEDAATAAALDDCRSNVTADVASLCNVVSTFNRGCRWAAGGCKTGTEACGYFLAATKSEALSKCSSQWDDCQVEGGCVGQ